MVSKKKKLFLIAGIAVGLILIGAGVYFAFKTKLINSIFRNSGGSVFRNLTDSSLETEEGKPDFEYKDLTPYQVNLVELQKIFNPDFAYWEDWSWENKMIEGHIVSVIGGNITFKVSNPVSFPLYSKPIITTPNCPLDSTILVSSEDPTQRIIDGGFDFIKQAKRDDSFFAFCLDESCSKIGKQCVLVETFVLYDNVNFE